ncbi:uncharacterized protein E0L32_001020 [Thyridium curvatum]|uniref:Gfd2/YDR514C-like C-terminal domain-containing protein n=1 Tax=Thyridium curvatum TaxID=1093900 RepID=A0A507AMU9_9PEZI|nr:uncharacterized protein E0L32_001020 [Thyridium curvatum]TPX11202.1 hypothetical protein E0L32_001020 [Thyridium curvatum]
MAVPVVTPETDTTPIDQFPSRVENIILRELFGYTSVTNEADLSRTPLLDVLLVAVDIDTQQGYSEILPDHQFHIGVSTLDSRALLNPAGTLRSGKGPTPTIQSLQFTIGDSRYCRKASKRFLFGLSEPSSLSSVKSRLETIASGRNVVLVPIFVVDTVKAAQEPLSLPYRYSLEKLLEALEIPYKKLHAAGNDAHFALRVLLMIIAKDAERQPETQHSVSLIRALKEVALAPIP